MSLGYNENTEELPEQPAVVSSPPPARLHLVVHRSTVRDSWSWLWKDTLGRVVPLAAAGLVYLRFAPEWPRRGRRRSAARWQREVALGTALGVPLAVIAALFRAWVAPGYRLPTPADQAVQTTFYLAINAPAEEIFWRGTVQALTTRLLRRVPRLRPAAGLLGWAFATTTYGAYHRLGGWSWRSIAGVTAVGGLFGWLFVRRPREHALLAVTLAHGFATAGFLSWGDVLLHRLAVRRLIQQIRATGVTGPIMLRRLAGDQPAERSDQSA